MTLPTALAHPLRLGTRASPLAMAQVHLVAAALKAAHGWSDGAIEIVPVTASGDKVLDRLLADIGGKALWTKELDQWLLEGRIDAAVHSMKDVETLRPDALEIAAMLPRADVRDSIVGASSIAAIPKGGRLGTSSPRRSAQVTRMRPDVQIVLFRGNVARRLARLEQREAEVTLLATAGLMRLGEQDAGTPISVEEMLPAPAQGAIGVETLGDNAEMRSLLAAIDHAATSACVRVERALLRGLGGTCHSPIAALAVMEGGEIRLRAEILSPDGAEHVAREQVLPRASAEALAEELGHEMLRSASPSLRALFMP
ncbi:MAG: hydroxymethylbilane synthase [Sphingobium sp.]|nr:hydroxymethylbilane synthase [Sphingobium sp.]MBP8671499.1 hydroxymethylbilane synthase [Sphingobium sp.]MBP9158014.1 hydroxymethylbilane synthase [Sphingobium sp.]MCC6482225.1 hydroxymethylbilane synthase [Sphingomonadaceae bacterium]